MPTEWERNSPDLDIASEGYTVAALLKSKDSSSMDKDINGDTSSSMGPNSPEIAATNGHNGSSCSSSGRKTSLTSPDPTAYVAKARVTRPTPPPPSYNPMQFVQIKPCNLYQTAQQQLKKAEDVKKIKEIQKEEPEEWQNNLDNWKSSRRKRVEHIIDRVVEVKKLELEEHDRVRRKSKTFSEMIEERGDRGVRVGRAKLVSLAVYNEDESNDLSDLGIGTSSASGKSSVSEDYENSVASENTESLEKKVIKSRQTQNSTTRDYVSSPGYDTSTSTAPASSPDPCEYTYEGAIQDYKQRVSKATKGGSSGYSFHNNNRNQIKSFSSTPKESIFENDIIESTPMEAYASRRGCKIEERLIGFEVSSPNDCQDLLEKNKIDLPKIDISKRKEIFECASNKRINVNSQEAVDNKELKPQSSSIVPRVTLRDHFKLEDEPPATVQNEVKRLSGDITSIKDRLQSLEQQNKLVNSVSGIQKTTESKILETPLPPLKDRVTSLKNAATKDDIKKPPVVLVDARQLEIMKDEDENAKQRLLDNKKALSSCMIDITLQQPSVENKDEELDRDDSGIHTSVDIEEHYISEQKLREQVHEDQLNEALSALAKEEQNLELAANAVNMFELEFSKLPIASNQKDMVAATNLPAATNEQPCEMEFSVSSTNDLFEKHTILDQSYSNINRVKGAGNDVGIVPVGIAIEEYSAKKGSQLQRKLSNEMVHARNLLKMFKETFNNDTQLDEEHEDFMVETKPKCNTQSSSKLNNTEVFLNSSSNLENQQSALSMKTSMSSQSMHPNGKPPSPKSQHFVSTLPPNGSISPHKPNSPFSINGRVEVFNSKYMANPIKPSTIALKVLKKSLLPISISNTGLKSEQPSKTNNKPTVLQTQATNSAKPTLPLTNLNMSTENDLVRFNPDNISEQEIPLPSPRLFPTSSHSFIGQTEIVRSVPPISCINPDELPIPNTVKILTNCFSINSDQSQVTPLLQTPPKPLPRNRCNIDSQSNLQRAEVENLENQVERHNDQACQNTIVQCKEGLDVSNSMASPSSIDSSVSFETKALVHDPPLTFNDSISFSSKSLPKTEPLPISCTPNESILYKLVSSSIPSTSVNSGSSIKSGAFNSGKNFHKVLNSPLPVSELSSHFQSPTKQLDVDDEICKMNEQYLPPNSQGTYKKLKSQERNDFVKSSMTNSPIMAARAAHSKALIETCEKIIAEERQARSQMSSSLPTTPTSVKSTPILERKSKIPKPIQCCIRGSDSMSKSDSEQSSATQEQEVDQDGLLVGRLHVVETQIKVTTTTPPTSPKPEVRFISHAQGNAIKPKTKNIFEFLKKNFGHHKVDESTYSYGVSYAGHTNSNDAEALDKILTVDNSKFYIPTVDTPPPPLPLSPVPVNIEITKKITTNEILDESTSEMALSNEINNLLDEEFNKLSTTSVELEKD